MTIKKTSRTRTLSAAALLGSALMLTGVAGTHASTDDSIDVDALIDDLEEQMTDADNQVNGEHIGLAQAGSEYLLAPNQSAYWAVSANSLTGLETEATAALYVSGTFGADITVVDTNSGDVLLNDHTADMDGTVDFDAFDLVDGRDYLVEVQADENTPELEDITVELTVNAEGESIPITPGGEEPPTPEPTPEPDEPADPDEPVSDEQPPEPDEPNEEPVVPDPVEEAPAEETAEDSEEAADTPTIASGVIPEEDAGVLVAALTGLAAGLAALVFGIRRLFKNKNAVGDTH